MLTQEHYNYLDGALRSKLTVRPATVPYPFSDGHVPQHTQCQLTAMHLENTRGWGAQIGIQWLDKMGRLLPWVHVVNWVDGQLVDFSCSVLEPKLAFTLIGNDVDMANSLVMSVDDPTAQLPTGAWADPFARQLHEAWFAQLKAFSLRSEPRFLPSF